MNAKKKSTYDAFVTNYKNISPLIIFSTLDKVDTLGKAFDVLQDFDSEIKHRRWNEQNTCWERYKFSGKT